MSSEVKHIEVVHVIKHRATKAMCVRCGRDIRAGLTYCRVCGALERRKASRKSARTRRLMALAREASNGKV